MELVAAGCSRDVCVGRTVNGDFYKWKRVKNRGKTSVKAPPGRDSYHDTGGGRKQSLILGGEEDEGGRGRREEGEVTHTNKRGKKKKKAPVCLCAHNASLCAR